MELDTRSQRGKRLADIIERLFCVVERAHRYPTPLVISTISALVFRPLPLLLDVLSFLQFFFARSTAHRCAPSAAQRKKFCSPVGSGHPRCAKPTLPPGILSSKFSEQRDTYLLTRKQNAPFDPDGTRRVDDIYQGQLARDKPRQQAPGRTTLPTSVLSLPSGPLFVLPPPVCFPPPRSSASDKHGLPS